MTTSQAEAVARCRKAVGLSGPNEMVDHSASHPSKDSYSLAPRIYIEQYTDPIPSAPATHVNGGHGLDWEEDTDRYPQQSNHTFSQAQSQPSLSAYMINNQCQEVDRVGGQLATPEIERLRRDSLFKLSGKSDRPRNGITYPHDSPDTTSGAEISNDELLLNTAQYPIFSQIIDGPAVESPVDEYTRGGAEPLDESEDDISLSANTSFDYTDLTREELDRKRPYTSSLDPPSRWDHGHSPDSSDIISDAGDQQELQLRHKGFRGDSAAQRSVYSLDDSLASLPPSDCNDVLQAQIHDAFESTRLAQGDYLPRGLLCTLINEDTVARELRQHLLDIRTPGEIATYAKTICSETIVTRQGISKLKTFRKIFALLVLVEATKYILQFLEEDVSDLDLPLTLIKHNRLDGFLRKDTTIQDAKEPLRCLGRRNCTPTRLRTFNDYQWKLLAPFFSQDRNGDVKHYKLNDRHVLPFLALTDLAEKDAEKQGGFGRVQLVDIHPDHHNFRSERSPGRGFAVKEQLYEDDRDYFKNEINILKKFTGARSHPHIVSLLATYEQFKKFHLIFHRAEGNLFTYWKELRDRPQVNYQNVLWMAKQCRGLVHGLCRLHRLFTLPKSQGGTVEEPTQYTTATAEQIEPEFRKGRAVTFSKQVRMDSWEWPASPICTVERRRSPYKVRQKSMDHAETEEERHTKKYGRHGDINPNNILWFDGEPGDNENLTGTLKLADFGQAELNTLLSRTWTGTVANTLTYRPPECDMEGKDIRQSFDIWCLGCVLLEFVAWILGGGQLVTKFGQSRCAPDFFRADEKADTFFQFSVNLSTQVTEVVVKESVTNFIDELHKHEMCSKFFHDFLDMVEHEMLVIDSSERTSCEGILRCLNDMYEKCCSDQDYAVVGKPMAPGESLFFKR